MTPARGVAGDDGKKGSRKDGNDTRERGGRVKLNLSDKLPLPVDATTQALAFLGRRGSGKTYAASKLAELMHGAHAQFVAIDPVGVWWSLRLAADGKGLGLDVPIFGGLHGDIPLEATAGAMLADVVVDRGISAVLDVSQFESDSDKSRFARDFAARFFFRKKSSPSAVHIFIEEAQEFIPQNIQKGEEQMLHAFQRMIRLGRNFGIGVSMLSQRPQDVNKKALNQAECLLCFQLTGPQERKAVEGWVSDKGLDEDLGKILPNLKMGHAHVWSPVWLDVNEEVFIAEKETFSAGTTPKVGAKPVATRPLEPLELEQLHRDIAATVQRVKDNDPRELKKRIAQLEKQIAGRPAETKTVEVEKIVEVPVLKNGQLDRTEKIADRLQKFAEQFMTETSELRRLIAPASAPRPPARPVVSSRAAAVRSPRHATPKSAPDPEGRDALTGPERKIIDAIAWLDSVCVPEPEQTAVAFLAGYTYGGGGFNNPRGALKTKGLVEYQPGNKIKLTDAGRAVAEFPDEVLTTEELHKKVLAVLPGPESKLMAHLFKTYPNVITNEELAEATGYTFGSGGYNNPRGRLRTLGLIEYVKGGVVARDILFLEPV